MSQLFCEFKLKNIMKNRLRIYLEYWELYFKDIDIMMMGMCISISNTFPHE